MPFLQDLLKDTRKANEDTSSIEVCTVVPLQL